MILSETGSGKTLAYLIPALNRIYHTRDRLEREKVTISGEDYTRKRSHLRPNKLSLAPSVSNITRGGLIMTSSQHLLSQIELLISDLDYKNTLNLSLEDGSSHLPTNFKAYDMIL